MAILETVTFTNTTASPVALNGFVTDGGFTFTSGTNNLTVAVEDYAGRSISGANTRDYAFISDLAPTTADYSVKCDLLVRSITDFHDASIWARVTGTVGDTGYEARVNSNSNLINLWVKTSGSGGTLGVTYSLVGTPYDLSNAASNPVLVPVEIRAVGDQISVYLDGTLILGPVTDTTHTAAGTAGISMRSAGSDEYRFDNLVIESLASATVDYTIRKASTAVEITHTLTAGGITSAALNGQALTLGTQSGQVVKLGFTDTITTSGEYPLVLGDGVGTQTFTVQYNVIGLPSSTLKKEGEVLANLTNLEIVILSGGFPPRTILDQFTGITTDAGGNTGNIIIPNPLAVVGENVNVFLKSFPAEVGIAYGAKPELL